ncbi:hypothetical protein IWX50DRAFT_477422 [Phyllosticta citricarpa]
MARERPVSCPRCCDALSGPSFSSVFRMGSIGLRRLQELRLLLCLVLLVTTAATRKRPQKKKVASENPPCRSGACPAAAAAAAALLLGPRVFIASAGFWATTVLCLQKTSLRLACPSFQQRHFLVPNLEINVARLGLLPHRVQNVLGLFLRAQERASRRPYQPTPNGARRFLSLPSLRPLILRPATLACVGCLCFSLSVIETSRQAS